MELTLKIDGQTRTVELPDEVVEALQSLADRHGITLEQAIGQAIVNQKFLEDQLGPNGELIVKKDDRESHFEFA